MPIGRLCAHIGATHLWHVPVWDINRCLAGGETILTISDLVLLAAMKMHLAKGLPSVLVKRKQKRTSMETQIPGRTEYTPLHIRLGYVIQKRLNLHLLRVPGDDETAQYDF
jgi:hypothetical protein